MMEKESMFGEASAFTVVHRSVCVCVCVRVSACLSVCLPVLGTQDLALCIVEYLERGGHSLLAVQHVAPCADGNGTPAQKRAKSSENSPTALT